MKWYKQSTTEHLNADLRNACSNVEDNKVSWKDVCFLCTKGLLGVLKEKIADNLDLKRAVFEYGKYMTTVRMDRSMFQEICKCKDWDLIERCLSYLNNSGSRISFYEEGDIIAIDIPKILEELDNYSTAKYKEKIKTGEIKLIHSTDSNDNVVVDKNTGEVIESEHNESDTHTDSYMNKDDNDLTNNLSTKTHDEQVVLWNNRRKILESIGKSNEEISKLLDKEFGEDFIPF
jgi:hypothetical protein